MSYRKRFEDLVSRLAANDRVRVKPPRGGEYWRLSGPGERGMHVGPPTPPEQIAAARAVAGASWPDGMTELYEELSFVDIAYDIPCNRRELESFGHTALNIPNTFAEEAARLFADPEDRAVLMDGGKIQILPVGQVWDFDALEDVLWFSDPELDAPGLRLLRPIDIYDEYNHAVLYPVPGRDPRVHDFNIEGHLTDTGLSYRAWLERVLRSCGVRDGLQELCLLRAPREPDEEWSHLRQREAEFDHVCAILGLDATELYGTRRVEEIDLWSQGK